MSVQRTVGQYFKDRIVFLIFLGGVLLPHQGIAQVDVSVVVNDRGTASSNLVRIGRLTTSPIQGESFVCVVVNTSSSEIVVRSAGIFNQNGILAHRDTTNPVCPVSNSSTPAMVLAPGQMCHLLASTPPVNTTPKLTVAYCSVNFTPGDNIGLRSTIWSRLEKNPQKVYMTAYGIPE